MKLIFCLIMFLVLNVIDTVPSIVSCSGGTISLSLCITPPEIFDKQQYPHTDNNSVWPESKVWGRGGLNDVSCAWSPSGHNSSTFTTEQSLEPALLSNILNSTVCSELSTNASQSLVSNSLGFARFNNSRTPVAIVINKANVVNTPNKYPFQNFHLVLANIPSEYIFYQWGFIVLAIWRIIEGIIYFIKR